jgi:hypothetical protein
MPSAGIVYTLVLITVNDPGWWEVTFYCTVQYARTNVIGSRTSFVIASVLAYIEIYVFRVNPFQAHSLEQSYHPTQPLKQEKIIQNQKCKVKII